MKIIVIGNQGSGKTLLAQDLLKIASIQDYTLIDEWDGATPIPNDCIAITNANVDFCERNGLTRSFAVSAAGKTFEQRAARLYKITARLLPVNLLLKLCVAPYKLGIFCLKLFDVLFEQLKLSVDQGEVLLEHGSALNVE